MSISRVEELYFSDEADKITLDDFSAVIESGVAADIELLKIIVSENQCKSLVDHIVGKIMNLTSISDTKLRNQLIDIVSISKVLPSRVLLSAMRHRLTNQQVIYILTIIEASTGLAEVSDVKEILSIASTSENSSVLQYTAQIAVKINAQDIVNKVMAIDDEWLAASIVGAVSKSDLYSKEEKVGIFVSNAHRYESSLAVCMHGLVPIDLTASLSILFSESAGLEFIEAVALLNSVIEGLDDIDEPQLGVLDINIPSDLKINVASVVLLIAVGESNAGVGAFVQKASRFDTSMRSTLDRVFSKYISSFEDCHIESDGIDASFKKTIFAIGKKRLMQNGLSVKERDILFDNDLFSSFFIENLFKDISMLGLNMDRANMLIAVVERFCGNEEVLYKVECFMFDLAAIKSKDIREALLAGLYQKSLYMDYLLAKLGVHVPRDGDLLLGMCGDPIFISGEITAKDEKSIFRIIQEKEYSKMLESFQIILPHLKLRYIRGMVFFAILSRADFEKFDLGLFDKRELKEYYYAAPLGAITARVVVNNLKRVKGYV